MTFEIIGTGSSGNCFLIDEKIMIDIGLPYARIKDRIKSIEYVLCTHQHTDHLNQTAIRKVFVNTNAIFVCGKFLYKELSQIGVTNNRILTVEVGEIYNLGEYKISPIMAYHDVDNFAFRILHNGKKHLHITDTVTLDGIEAKGYDSASIECNHEINKALELIKQAKDNGEFTHLQGAINSHLAVDKVIRFCKDNGIKKLYPVHIGNSTRKEVKEALQRW